MTVFVIILASQAALLTESTPFPSDPFHCLNLQYFNGSSRPLLSTTLFLGQLFVRPYVCTSIQKKVYLISMKFGMYVEVDEWCTMVCSMTRSDVIVTSPSELEILPFSKAISSAIYNGSWQVTTDL